MCKPANSGGNQGKDTRFKPGRSGNPAGKPPGTRHRATMAVEKLFMVESDAEAIAKKVMELARAGEQWAVTAVLQRIAPPRRSSPIRLDLPTIENAADLPRAVAAVIDAMAAGTIDPDEAAVVASVLEAKRRALETADIERRLSALEAKEEK